MAVVITIVATIAIIGIISAFILIRPNKTRSYARKIEQDYREPGEEPVARPLPLPRPSAPRLNNPATDNSLMPLVMGVLRVAIGLAGLVLLGVIFNSTQGAAGGLSGADLTAVYAGGIFKAVITIGIAVSLCIFTKFSK
jgi:hypothetical protein